MLDWSGANVWREFYVNDVGNQIEKFAKSIEARYFQLIKGEDAVEFPEDGYHGDDIKELAQAFYAEHGESYLDKTEAERHADMARFGLDRNIPKMKSDLERYGIKFDEWFFESSLHESGFVADTAKKLTDLGWTYEKDGALWVKTAEIMRDQYRKQGKKDEDIDKLGLKDDVLRRANGFYTYFAARHRLPPQQVRGPRLRQGHQHLGRRPPRPCRPPQGRDATRWVSTARTGWISCSCSWSSSCATARWCVCPSAPARPSALHDLLDEIPVDACRYFFNAKPDTQMDFDLGLAVREDSENPVYYVQYAHARICSLAARRWRRRAAAFPPLTEVDLSPALRRAGAARLSSSSAQFREEIRLAARRL